MITLITDHVEQAKARLRELYKRQPNIEAILTAFVDEIQALEEAIFGISSMTSIYDSIGEQLDMLGRLLDLGREGFDDEQYRIRLLAKIAQNVSKGTPEDVINVFKLLMRARYVQLEEVFPASMNLTAIGANQIGDIADIKDAVKESALAGVSIDIFAVVSNIPFVFLDDPDPLGEGFGDTGDPLVGGEWNSFV